jgi:hypothetical protein
MSVGPRLSPISLLETAILASTRCNKELWEAQAATYEYLIHIQPQDIAIGLRSPHSTPPRQLYPAAHPPIYRLLRTIPAVQIHVLTGTVV